MPYRIKKIFLLSLLMFTAIFANFPPAMCEITTEVSDRFTYIEDGDFSKQLHIPTYEWIPKDVEPKGVVFACHGLTLHGKTFQVTGRAFADHGFYFIAPDMRGFGRCYKDPSNKFSDAKNNRHVVNYKKSHEDLLALAKLVKERYPNIPIILLGESLGCTTAVHLASESPQTFHSLILSAPAMRLNPAMFLTPASMQEYTIGFSTHLTSGISMNSFFKHLVSNDPQVVEEALADPLIRKALHPRELIRSLIEIKRTTYYAKRVQKGVPVLVIQGSDDKCVEPKSVANLVKNIESEDQTIRWFYSYGHLAFETSHLRAAILDALISWFREHRPEHKILVEELQKNITALGGTVRD